jgi:hypothetical protein
LNLAAEIRRAPRDDARHEAAAGLRRR